MAIDAVVRRMMLGVFFAVAFGATVAVQAGWLIGTVVALGVFLLVSGAGIALLVLVGRRQR
jgi:hypothetical protein